QWVGAVADDEPLRVVRACEQQIRERDAGVRPIHTTMDRVQHAMIDGLVLMRQHFPAQQPREVYPLCVHIRNQSGVIPPMPEHMLMRINNHGISLLSCALWRYCTAQCRRPFMEPRLPHITSDIDRAW